MERFCFTFVKRLYFVSTYGVYEPRDTYFIGIYRPYPQNRESIVKMRIC